MSHAQLLEAEAGGAVDAAMKQANASLAARFGFDPEAGLVHLRVQGLLLHAPCPDLPPELVAIVLAHLTKAELVAARVWRVSRAFAAAFAFAAGARDWSALEVCCEEGRAGGDVLSSRSVALLPRAVAAKVTSVSLTSAGAVPAHPKFRETALPALQFVRVGAGCDQASMPATGLESAAEQDARGNAFAASIASLFGARELDLIAIGEETEEEEVFVNIIYNAVMERFKRGQLPHLTRIFRLDGIKSIASVRGNAFDIYDPSWELCCLETRSTFASLAVWSANDWVSPTAGPSAQAQPLFSQPFTISDLAQDRPDELVAVGMLDWRTFRDLRPAGGFPNLEALAVQDSEVGLDEFGSIFAQCTGQAPLLRILAISTDTAEYITNDDRWQRFGDVPPSVTQLFLEFDSCYLDDVLVTYGATGPPFLGLVCPHLSPSTTCHVMQSGQHSMHAFMASVMRGEPAEGKFVSRQGSKS